MVESALPIACAINRHYVLPLAVMLESLKERLRDGVKPVLYLLHEGIPEESLAAIAAILETHPIVPSAGQIAATPRSHHFPREAAFPLLLPELLPRSVQRVLFLDADMLVMDDLTKLWETPLDGHVLAAAPDAAVHRCSAGRGVKNWEPLGIPHDAAYFNCGVLMIDLKRWRERDVTSRVHQYLRRTGNAVDFLHQEALNAVLWNDWKPLDPRWNLLASLAGRSHEKPPTQDWRDPGIVHFAGRMKPWRAPIGGPFHAPYRAALLRTVAKVPAEHPTVRDRLHSVYDRYFRGVLFPVEQYLWRRRLI